MSMHSPLLPDVNPLGHDLPGGLRECGSTAGVIMVVIWVIGVGWGRGLVALGAGG